MAISPSGARVSAPRDPRVLRTLRAGHLHGGDWNTPRIRHHQSALRDRVLLLLLRPGPLAAGGHVPARAHGPTDPLSRRFGSSDYDWAIGGGLLPAALRGAADCGDSRADRPGPATPQRVPIRGAADRPLSCEGPT